MAFRSALNPIVEVLAAFYSRALIVRPPAKRGFAGQRNERRQRSPSPVRHLR